MFGNISSWAVVTQDNKFQLSRIGRKSHEIVMYYTH